MERKIIVFGATGNTGIEICKALDFLKVEHDTFVRENSKSKIKTDLSRIVLGDVLKIEEVEKALNSQKYTDIIIALGSRNLKDDDIRSNGTKHIVDTLNAKAQKSKLHVISAHGIGESWSHLKWYEKLVSKLFIAKTMKDHELQERIVKTNAGGFHIIRPVALKNTSATGKIFSIEQGALPKGSITRADVAKFTIDSLLENNTGIHSICNI